MYARPQINMECRSLDKLRLSNKIRRRAKSDNTRHEHTQADQNHTNKARARHASLSNMKTLYDPAFKKGHKSSNSGGEYLNAQKRASEFQLIRSLKKRICLLYTSPSPRDS